MHDLTGWSEIGCTEFEIVRINRATGVSSSLTDQEGRFGSPVIYTEWADEDGRAVLRNYLHDPNSEQSRCRHFVPEGFAIEGVER